MAFEKHDAIVVDPDLDSRMRLKQAMTSVSSFGTSLQFGKLKEALSKLETANAPTDVIFLSYRFEEMECLEFIAQAKKFAASQDSAFILIKRSQDRQSTAVAASVLGGADGLLFEPFSVEQLVEITQIASRVKMERSQEREKVALNFLLDDVINQIDQLAYLKSCDYETGPTMRKLKEMCAVFQTLSAESKQSYYQFAVDKFEATPVPKLIFQRKKYAGVSSRVAKRIEKKMLNDIENAGSEEPAAANTKS